MRRHFRNSALLRSVLPLTAAIAACSPDSAPPLAMQTGQFVDSPVEGLAYAGATKRTGPDGSFEYPKDATIQFQVGDIRLGDTDDITGATRGFLTLRTVSDRGPLVVTPVELIPNAPDENNQPATNIARFLLTIDEDFDAANGIRIVEELHEAASDLSIDFEADDMDFEEAVQPIIDSFEDVLGEARTLVSAEDASVHLGIGLRGRISGRYRGTYIDSSDPDMTSLGDWEIFVTREGDVCGWLLQRGGAQEKAITGQATSDGEIEFDVASSGLSFSGEVDYCDFAGLWDNSSNDTGGSFEAECQDARAASLVRTVDPFTGTYAGQIEGGGTLEITVDASGDLSATDPVLCGSILLFESDSRVRFSAVSDQGDTLSGTIESNGTLRGRSSSRDGTLDFTLTRP